LFEQGWQDGNQKIFFLEKEGANITLITHKRVLAVGLNYCYYCSLIDGIHVCFGVKTMGFGSKSMVESKNTD